MKTKHLVRNIALLILLVGGLGVCASWLWLGASPAAMLYEWVTNADKRAPLEYVANVGQRNALGQFGAYASAVVVNPQGEIIVADQNNRRLQGFAPEGVFLRTLPLTETYPHDLALLPDGNWVLADWWQNEVEIRTPTGELLQVFADWPPPAGGYVNPTTHIDSVAPGAAGELYIAEARGSRVVVLNPDGSLREVWFGPPERPLEDVMDIETDAAGNLYIVSDTQDRLLKRNPAGQVQEFVIETPHSIAPLPDGSFYAASDHHVRYYDATGKMLQQWQGQRVQDLAVTAEGSVVVLHETTSLGKAKLLVHYTNAGEEIASFGSTELQPGQFASHAAFAVSALGDVWVLDTGDTSFMQPPPISRLVHVDPQYQHLNTFETLGGNAFTCDEYRLTALTDQSVFVADLCASEVLHVSAAGEILQRWGQFNLIADMALAPDEHSIYILDAGNGRITQYGLDGQIRAEWADQSLGVKMPIALAVDMAGTFFLLDAETQQVVVRPTQGPVLAWALPDADDEVHRIAVDPTRQRIYVGGSDIHLYAFDWQGGYLGRVTVSDSRGVMVNVGPAGYVYRSAGFEAIQVFAPTD